MTVRHGAVPGPTAHRAARPYGGVLVTQRPQELAQGLIRRRGDLAHNRQLSPIRMCSFPETGIPLQMGYIGNPAR